MLNINDLENKIIEEMDEHKVPGLSIAVVKDNNVIYSNGFGMTSVEENGVKVSPDTLFRIGSVTKPLTASAIMRLVDLGKIDLDIPIKNYISWFTLNDQKAASCITLRMLLSHTSGLTNGGDLTGRRDLDGLEKFVSEDILQLPLFASPGKVYSYSNYGLNLAGYILEVILEKSYGKIMQELLFQPLDMKHTTFDPMVAMTQTLAFGHTLNKDGTVSVQRHFAENVANYPSFFAISTAMDLANFSIMQMNQGIFRNNEVLTSKSIKEMHKVQAKQYTTFNSGMGLSFFFGEHRGTRLVRHFGGIGSFNSALLMAPDQKISAILLHNRPLPTSLSIIGKVMDSLLEQKDQKRSLPAKGIEKKTTKWEMHRGTYIGNDIGLAEITVEEDQLILNLNHERMVLTPFNEGVYRANDESGKQRASVGFIPEENDKTKYIMINKCPCSRYEADVPFLSPDSLKKYIGEYRHCNLLTLTVEMKNGKLVALDEQGEEGELFPIGEDFFAGSVWNLAQFELSIEGNAVSLILDRSWKYNRILK
jgi:CubicO group peptidase (beta-lactamase class C family)